jgi:tight adherence protein B
MTRTSIGACATALAAVLFVLGAAPAWADPQAAVSSVSSDGTTLSFVLSANGLAEGESIDPSTVAVSIDGESVQTTAKPIAESAEAPDRTVLLVLDSSGPMAARDKLATAQEAALAYLDGLPADVRAGLVAFADDAELVVRPTTDRARVERAVDRLKAKGATALYDAVELAVDTLGPEGTRNIVLLSDGKDEGSSATPEDATGTLHDSGVVLDAVSLGAGDQVQQLEALAEAGNGTTVTATSAGGLVDAFESAARSVNSQLTVQSEIPAGLAPGLWSMDVSADVGEDTIATSVAFEQPEAPTESPEPQGPIPVAERQPGVVGSTWFLLLPMALVFTGLGGIVAIAVGAMDDQNRKRGRIGRRLARISVAGGSTPAVRETSPSAAPQTVLGESAPVRHAVSLADSLTARLDSAVITGKLESANLALRPGEWVVVHLLIAVLAGLLAFLLTTFNLPFALVAFVLGLILPWVYLTLRADRRRRAFYGSLPDSMQMLAGSLSAGYALPQALDNVAREAGGPMSEELNRALLESRLGMPLDEALEAAAARMRSTDFHWVVMAIRINRQVGGNLAEVLTNVGQTIRQRERLRRQVKSLSAEGVLSAWILALMPVAIGGFVALTRPEYLSPLFTTPMGWLMCGAGLLLYLIGLVWLRRLVTMEV